VLNAHGKTPPEMAKRIAQNAEVSRYAGAYYPFLGEMGR
jgi:hypothetical protein